MKVVIFLCMIAAAVSIQCYWGNRNKGQDFDQLVEANIIQKFNCAPKEKCYNSTAADDNAYGCGPCKDEWTFPCASCDSEDFCNGSATATTAALAVAAAYWIFQ